MKFSILQIGTCRVSYIHTQHKKPKHVLKQEKEEMGILISSNFHETAATERIS